MKRSDLDEKYFDRLNTRTIKTDNCWIWTGTYHHDGYGIMTVRLAPKKRKSIRVNRLAYLNHYGNLDDAKVICHTCDNPKCVRPNHLYEGTAEDNMRDQLDRTSDRKGERNSNAKLTWEQVVQLRWKYDHRKALAITSKDLAKEYQIHPHMVYLIGARKNWVKK